MAAANREQDMSGNAPHRSGRMPVASGFAARIALVAAAPLAVAIGLLTIEDALDLGGRFLVMPMTVGFVVVTVLLAIGIGTLRAAEARTSAAVERAVAAEATQRFRADELARVLKASESLALSGEGQVDYLAVLEAITPDGATSFLVRADGEVVAAHGPLAASVVGIRRQLPGPGADFGGNGAPITSSSASRRVAGVAVPREHMAGAEAEIGAGLTIRLVDHGGGGLGWLHMLDHRGERILGPGFVNLAQLVASQIGVAMENNGLLARVRMQLVEVQRVQQQLVQASKLGAVGELAAAVAHEVNNPLTGILGYAELLMNELPADDPRHDEASVIREEAVRARSIIKALLEFARPRQPQRIPTNLNDLVRSTLELVRFRASDADVRISADYGELPCLDVDADACWQVFLNLFNNAIDAMPRGGRLHLTTLETAGRVGVRVTDEGVGMDEDTRGRIFTPFLSTRSGADEGNGLGLSVCLQIVESHSGTIEVESAPGKGSAFTVWLPRTWTDEEVPGGVEIAVPGPSAALGPCATVATTKGEAAREQEGSAA